MCLRSFEFVVGFLALAAIMATYCDLALCASTAYSIGRVTGRLFQSAVVEFVNVIRNN